MRGRTRTDGSYEGPGGDTRCRFYKRRARPVLPTSSSPNESHGMSNARRYGMPEKATVERARKHAREGKSPSTQAGEFVREEIEHIREGRHGAQSTKQAIAIGL